MQKKTKKKTQSFCYELEVGMSFEKIFFDSEQTVDTIFEHWKYTAFHIKSLGCQLEKVLWLRQ